MVSKEVTLASSCVNSIWRSSSMVLIGTRLGEEQEDGGGSVLTLKGK